MLQTQLRKHARLRFLETHVGAGFPCRILKMGQHLGTVPRYQRFLVNRVGFVSFRSFGQSKRLTSEVCSEIVSHRGSCDIIALSQRQLNSLLEIQPFTVRLPFPLMLRKFNMCIYTQFCRLQAKLHTTGVVTCNYPLTFTRFIGRVLISGGLLWKFFRKRYPNEEKLRLQGAWSRSILIDSKPYTVNRINNFMLRSSHIWTLQGTSGWP